MHMINIVVLMNLCYKNIIMMFNVNLYVMNGVMILKNSMKKFKIKCNEYERHGTKYGQHVFQPYRFAHAFHEWPPSAFPLTWIYRIFFNNLNFFTKCRETYKRYHKILFYSSAFTKIGKQRGL
jgi:hypothetical protein